MGNRCVITTSPFKPENAGIYLHWNGGIESVEAFCRAARELGYRSPDQDSYCGLARLTGLICLFFDITGDTSIGIGRCDELDTDGDNGTWLIGPNWKIVGWKPSSDSKTCKPPANLDPDKTEAIYRNLIVGARCCATAFAESSALARKAA